MIVTDNDELALLLRSFRNHGRKSDDVAEKIKAVHEQTKFPSISRLSICGQERWCC